MAIAEYVQVLQKIRFTYSPYCEAGQVDLHQLAQPRGARYTGADGNRMGVHFVVGVL